MTNDPRRKRRERVHLGKINAIHLFCLKHAGLMVCTFNRFPLILCLSYLGLLTYNYELISPVDVDYQNLLFFYAFQNWISMSHLANYPAKPVGVYFEQKQNQQLTNQLSWSK